MAEIRRYLEAQPAYAGFRIFSSDQRLRPLAEVSSESSLAGYTVEQLLRAPHLVDFFNQPPIVDFIEQALGCVPTLSRSPTSRDGCRAYSQHCPFLEEESCSIHPDRPLVCREYLVTSPAELCAGPTQEGVTPVAVPKVSPAARGLEESRPEADTRTAGFRSPS